MAAHRESSRPRLTSAELLSLATPAALLQFVDWFYFGSVLHWFNATRGSFITRGCGEVAELQDAFRAPVTRRAEQRV